MRVRARERAGNPVHASAAPRVLMLGKGWFPEQTGGLDRYYRDLIERLPDASGIVIGRPDGLAPNVTGVSSHTAPLPQRVLAFWRAAQAASDQTDVVDVHFALYGVVPLLLGKLRSKPVILHFHGPWADENTSAGDRSTLRLLARRRLERVTYRRADHAIVLTSAFRQVLVERYGVSPWKVTVLAPGVDLERFTPGSQPAARRELELAPDAFVAVAVRRLVPRMGLEVLVRAWGKIVAQLPPGSSLLIAGDGPLREVLQQEAAQTRQPESIRLLGRVSDTQLVDLYRAADIGVIPTLAHEGFGLVAIEAAACGTPSIVTNVGGLPEAVAGLDESLVVEAGDQAELASRLLHAVDERPTPAAMRQYAEHFSWDRVVDEHRELSGRVHRKDSDTRMKVVYLDHTAQASGGELALARLLPHLDRVQPHVILGQDGPLLELLHGAGVSAEVLALHATARELRKDRIRAGGVPVGAAVATAAYVLTLARRLRQLQPDLVHANSLKSGVYGGFAARLAGIPMIWHIRDYIDESYLPATAVRLMRILARHVPALVLANSRMTLESIRVPEHSVVVYSILPEVVTPRSKRERSSDALTFGIIGRLAPWKGQDFFLRSFAQTFPDGDERAVIVGDALFGEDDYAAGLRTLANDLGIAERVEFRGHRKDVWSELARFDVLVHASLTPEPFGQVILEGMAAGVPVVAANAGGPSEILTDERTGLLYEPGNPGALATALRRTRDPELRSRLVEAASAALDPYRPEVVADQLQGLYEQLLAG